MRVHLVSIALAAVVFPGLSSERCRGQENAVAVPRRQVGVLVHDPGACEGYTLLAPMTSNNTFLIDMKGRVVQTWRSDCQPALSAYLLENGDLLRSGTLLPGEQPFGGPGAGGRVQRFTWDGQLIWDFKLADDRQLPHHDIAPLPNGNVLVVAWDKKSPVEALAVGRRKELIGDRPVLADCVLEIKPTGKTTGEIVWKWHVWDHLIQDHDQTKANYGDVAAHPERIDVNLTESMFGKRMVRSDDDTKLRSLGVVAGTGRGLGEPAGILDLTADWTHVNSVDYNPALDQIVLSVRAFSEIWIIDHGTTTAEAAGHEGGRRGRGGDLLYRWGNPAAHRAGTAAHQRLFKQHHAHWILPGLPGEGRILLFNNGNNRLEGAYSTVDEIAVPVNAAGWYERADAPKFGPDQAEWSYAASNKMDLFSMVVSGAQRLPNGNTLICSGASGTLLEVTERKELVWKYINPVAGSFRGFRPRRGGLSAIGRGGLPAVNNSLFRAFRYTPDFPAIRGRELKPGELLEQLSFQSPTEEVDNLK